MSRADLLKALQAEHPEQEVLVWHESLEDWTPASSAAPLLFDPVEAPAQFSIGEALRFGWVSTVNSFPLLPGAVLLSFLITGGLEFLPQYWGEGEAWLVAAVLLWIVAKVLAAVFHMGQLDISLSLCKPTTPKFSSLFSSFHLVINCFITSLLLTVVTFIFPILGIALAMSFSSVATLIGGMLSIIPGIVLAVRLGFCYHALVDKNLGPIDALQTSLVITKGATLHLLLFSLVLLVLNIVGALLLLVGLLLTVPTSLVASTFVYRRLLAQARPVDLPLAARPRVEGLA